jgi:hypothetical protein
MDWGVVERRNIENLCGKSLRIAQTGVGPGRGHSTFSRAPSGQSASTPNHNDEAVLRSDKDQWEIFGAGE